MRRSLERALRFDISAGDIGAGDIGAGDIGARYIRAGARMTHLKQWVSQPLLTGPQASFGEPQNESIRSAAELIRRGDRPGWVGRVAPAACALLLGGSRRLKES